MLRYKLNPESPAFSYNRQELYDVVTRIVAHPHTTITEHDRARALAIFLAFSDYLRNHTECQEDEGCYIYESDSTDFEGFVLEALGEEPKDYGTVDAYELLK